jgi:hypothetical protein
MFLSNYVFDIKIRNENQIFMIKETLIKKEYKVVRFFDGHTGKGQKFSIFLQQPLQF